MATFSQNLGTVFYWGAQRWPITGTISGSTSRSGTTITVSNVKLALNWSQVQSGSGYADVTFTTPSYSPNSFRITAYSTTTVNLATYTFAANVGDAERDVDWSSSDGYSGIYHITYPSGQSTTPPTGGSVTWNSHTWNSVNITSRVTSWGTGYTGTPNLEQIIVQSSATSSTWEQTGRIVKQNATTSLSSTQSVSNANATLSLSGGITVKGCTSYKIAVYGSTNVGNTKALDNTTRYTPPAPLQSLSKASESYAGNNKSNVTVSVTGGNSTNNNNVSVSTQYRYSTNGGSSWTAWAQAGTGTPWTAKTAIFQVPCNTSIKVEARQVYQSQASEVKSLTFTSMKTPAMLYVPVSGKSKLGRKAYIGINGQSEKVLKIYKGVNGQAKLVYTG